MKAGGAHSLQAEQSVLGGLMLDERAYWRVADVLREEDFYRKDHQLIFRAIAEMSAANEPADAVTMGEWFDKKGLAELVGGSSYILQLANTTPSAANIRAYAAIVASKAEQRRVADAGARISALTGDGALADAQEILRQAGAGKASLTLAVRDVLHTVIASMQTQTDRDGSLTGISTGLPMLDDMTAGFQAGDLVLVAGRPSMGKSLLAMQFAERAAKAGHTAHVVTLEMPAAQCVLRMISADSEVAFDHVRDAKRLQDHEWPRVVGSGGTIGKLPLFFDEDVYELRDIVARIRQIAMQHKTRVVVIDYLQLIRGPRAERHDLVIAEITRELKLLAKALGITIILISQLSRTVEERGDKRPIMADLRDSGAIEQDADVILMVYRDGYYNPKSAHRDYAEILLRKQRNGPTGMVPARTRLDIQRFDSAPEGLPGVEDRDGGMPDFDNRRRGRK